MEFFNQIPWWLYPLVLGGGGAAAVFLIPGALPAVVTLWNGLPKPMRWTLIAVGSLGLAVLYGRNKGARDAREAQERRDAHAVQTRQNVDQEVRNLDKRAADDRLKPWLRD